MSALSPDLLQRQVLDRLAPHGSEGVRTELAGVVDLKALDDERYGDVLESVDSRLSTAQYSLISMLVAGIYFGLLVGHWLMDLTSWLLVARWVVPVGLVALYAIVTARNILDRMQRLSKARALIEHLADAPDAVTESTP